MSQLTRVLGVFVAVLAWTGAALAYYANGEIHWRLIAAGVFFAAAPFALPRPAK